MPNRDAQETLLPRWPGTRGATPPPPSHSDGIRNLLQQALGVSAADTTAPGIDDVELAPPALAGPHRDALASIVGAGHLRTGHLDRILHAGGKSTLDLLRRKQIRQDSPDAVLLPATEDEIARILAYCSEHAIAVVPFGGAPAWSADSTRSAAGSARWSPWICAASTPCTGSTRSPARPNWVRVSPGRTPNGCSGNGASGALPAELPVRHHRRLRRHPPSGQNSAGYGRFNDMIRGLHVVTPAGVLDLGRAPESAAGPDLRELITGSEGVFG